MFNFEEKCDNHTAGKKEILFEKGNPKVNEGNVENQTKSASLLKHDKRTQLDTLKRVELLLLNHTGKEYTSGNY